MPVNYRDVEMLNNSMQNMGNSFRQSRLDTEATRQRSIDNSLRERMLKNQEDRQARADEGITEAGLQGDDGVVVGYKGSPSGLQKMVDDAQKQGRTLRVVAKPEKKANIGTFTTSTPYGDVTLHINDTEDVPKLAAFAEKIGGTRKQPAGFNTRVGHDTKLITDLENKVAQATDPAAKAAAERELNVAKQLAGLDKATDQVTITEDYPAQEADITPAVPEVPARRNWFSPNTPAIPGKPAVTNAPALPARKITRKATPEELAAMPTVGKSPPAPQAGTNATSAKLPEGQYLRRADGKVRVKNPQGVKGWAKVDPNNLPEGFTLSD